MSNIINVNDMSFIITREYLISLLCAWQQNKISAKEVYETASFLYRPGRMETLDWEDNESYSVTSEVLQYLECLNINFVTQEDIDPAIEFLNTPIGKFQEGWKKWQQYTSSINYEERMKKLKGKHPYLSD